MTASPNTAAAVATHGGATLPDMPAGMATAADVVAIVARHLAVSDYLVSSTPGGNDIAAWESNALRWLLATISDHAATVGREAGRAADAAWDAAAESAAAADAATTREDRRGRSEFARLHMADAHAAEARFRAAGELATAVSEVLYP